jgi:hypothetical protein
MPTAYKLSTLRRSDTLTNEEVVQFNAIQFALEKRICYWNISFCWRYFMKRIGSLAFLALMFVLAIIPVSGLNSIAPQIGNTMNPGSSSVASHTATGGDHRLSGPIDARLVIYCNAPTGPVAIWGTDEESSGHGLVEFTMAEINSQSNQLARQALTVGDASLGTVFMTPHGDGRFSVSWVGGPWGANGTYPFALNNVNCQ